MYLSENVSSKSYDVVCEHCTLGKGDTVGEGCADHRSVTQEPGLKPIPQLQQCLFKAIPSLSTVLLAEKS